MAHRKTCRMISAQACACHPQIAHSTLLAMKQQKPSLRRPGRPEPMHQAASTVRTMAGHSRKSIQSFSTRTQLIAFGSRTGEHITWFRTLGRDSRPSELWSVAPIRLAHSRVGARVCIRLRAVFSRPSWLIDWASLNGSLPTARPKPAGQ